METYLWAKQWPVVFLGGWRVGSEG